MASPLAVLSEAAHVYEQMEQLKMAEQVSGLNFGIFSVPKFRNFFLFLKFVKNFMWMKMTENFS